MIGWVYVLHFDKPLSHARHYVGSTQCLRQRLTNHAQGRGSRLTRELYKRGIGWRLAALYQSPREAMRRIERLCKDHHQAAHFCPDCHRRTTHQGEAYSPPGVRSYPVESLPFTATSAALMGEAGLSRVMYRPSEAEARGAIDAAIKRLMKWDGDALGFIPVGGATGMTALINSGRVMLATCRRQIVGYAAWTMNHAETRIKVHQLCVDDAFRLCGIGLGLLAHVQANDPTAPMACTVRSDLPANDFWRAAGFRVLRERPHKSSGSTLIDYERTPDDAL